MSMKLSVEPNLSFVNVGCPTGKLCNTLCRQARSPLTKPKQLICEKHDRKACIHLRVRRSRTQCPRMTSERRNEDVNEASQEGAAPNWDVSIVERRTMAWVRQHVIGLNLCPFAEGVLEENSHRMRVSPASSDEGVLEEIGEEIQILIGTPAEEVSTTLLVLPNFAMNDFVLFHDICTSVENGIEYNEGLVDEVMFAFFHPLHEWADSDGVDDAINFDKRAPYPVVNLLRAPLVDRYIEQGRTQGILERNHDTLAKLGNSRLRQLFNALYVK